MVNSAITLLNNISARKKLEEDLSQAQNDLLSRQVEEMLKESEERYRRITDNMSDFVSEIDPRGRN
ncbi:hypothetical protein DS62_02740 [Smithella sp. SC_K08D17]|jgi:PAS domain-containing protein|nr:hypothetical protein KD27_01205 [Smithella sp. D17]KIE17513.1 hypothetical protein DS62_02740 [Smithella sp. SC_K08D17]